MKIIVFFLSSIFLFASCGDKNVSKKTVNDLQFYIDRNAGRKKNKNQDKFPDWVKVGAEGYGIAIIVSNVPGEDVNVGVPIKCRIVDEKKDGFKCLTLEDVPFYGRVGCDKLGIHKGEMWWETEGELYKTKEEAIDTLKQRDWYMEL